MRNTREFVLLVLLCSVVSVVPSTQAARAINASCRPQCVDLVAGRLGIKSPGNAKNWWYRPPSGYSRNLQGSSQEAPRRNDIIVWGSDVGGGYGHVAVVTEVDTANNTISFLDSNRVGPCQRGSCTTALERRGQGYSIGTGCVAQEPKGWLHRP